MTNTAPASARFRLLMFAPAAALTAKTETIILKTLSLNAPRNCVHRNASNPASWNRRRYPDSSIPFSAMKQFRDLLPHAVQTGNDAVRFHADQAISLLDEIVGLAQIGQIAWQSGRS